MFLEAIVTAITVSIDGFFSGFATGIKKTKINLKNLIIISSIPIIMAMPIMFLGKFLSKFINSNISNYIGFILFLYLTLSSYIQIKTDKDNVSNIKLINIVNSIIIGLTIGIDSSISAFSLALNNHNPIITPFYFGVSHGILIYLGNHIAFKKSILNIKYIQYLSPLLFIIIAITKIL